MRAQSRAVLCSGRRSVGRRVRRSQEAPGSVASVTQAVGAPARLDPPSPLRARPGSPQTHSERAGQAGAAAQPRGEGRGGQLCPAALSQGATCPSAQPADRCGPGAVCTGGRGGGTPRWDCASRVSLLCPPDWLSFVASGERPGRTGKGWCWGFGLCLLASRSRPPAATALSPGRDPLSQFLREGDWQAPPGSAVARWAHLSFKPSPALELLHTRLSPRCGDPARLRVVGLATHQPGDSWGADCHRPGPGEGLAAGPRPPAQELFTV